MDKSDKVYSLDNPIIKHFEYRHLSSGVQVLIKPIADAAYRLDFALPDGPEKDAGLRKLLEAKDCFVRAALEDQ